MIGGDEEDNRGACPELQRAGEIRCGYCMPYENHRPVYICRGFDPAAWPMVKHYN